MAIPHSTTGSLGPAFASARLVGLTVRLAYIHILEHLIANQAEPTFVLLRYSLGGYRPSKTDRLPVFLRQFDGKRLDSPVPKGGVSLATPPGPKAGVRSLPLTLSIETEEPVTAYSKGA